MSTDRYTVLGTVGCGSAIVEAALTLAGLPYDVDEVDYEKPGASRDRLRAKNPLGQVPTLLVPDGTIMTESAAIVLHLADLAPGAGLVPRPGDPARPRFLRWLMFLVASIYPTFTYGDDATRWVPGEPAQKALRASTDAFRQTQWATFEKEAGTPWFLGERFSALDVYVAVMTRWRPRRGWFAEACPRLHGIAQRVDAMPELAVVWRRNFP